METRSNHILVGVVVLALLAAVIGFTAWISGRGGGATKEYDIFFRQSVAGLDVGTSVSFNGVKVGTIKDIELWNENPEFVRVRIGVKESVPILIGTTAAVQSVGFAGASQITLSGAVKGAPPITAEGPAGIPSIPTRTAGLGALLNNAPQLVERLTTLTERLTEVLNDRNQQAIGNVLGNVDSLTRELRSTGPNLQATLGEARLAARQTALAAGRFGQLANSAQGTIGGVGADTQLMLADTRAMIGDMRKVVDKAERSLGNLDATINQAKPGLNSFSTQTVPELGQLMRDLRLASEALGSAASKIDQQGLGTLFTGKSLPDYQPAKGGKK